MRKECFGRVCSTRSPQREGAAGTASLGGLGLGHTCSFVCEVRPVGPKPAEVKNWLCRCSYITRRISASPTGIRIWIDGNVGSTVRKYGHIANCA